MLKVRKGSSLLQRGHLIIDKLQIIFQNKKKSEAISFCFFRMKRTTFPHSSEGSGFYHETGSYLRFKNPNFEYWNAFRSDPAPHFRWTPKRTFLAVFFGILIPAGIAKWISVVSDIEQEFKRKEKLAYANVYGEERNEEIKKKS